MAAGAGHPAVMALLLLAGLPPAQNTVLPGLSPGHGALDQPVQLREDGRGGPDPGGPGWMA